MTGERLRRVDVHLAGGGQIPVRVSSVELQSRPLPGMEAALFVHEGDLLTALQAMQSRGPGSLPYDPAARTGFGAGYDAAFKQVRELLRGSRIDLEEGKD